MDIQEQIDQFLQIEEIKQIISDQDIYWHVGEYSQGWYFDFSVPDYEKGFFLGAWVAWQAAKAQSDKKIKLLLCDEHLQKCESPAGIFNSQYPGEEPCLICLAKQAKAQAVPKWISVEDKLPPANILVLGMSQTPLNIFNIYNVMALDEFEEADVTHWIPLPDAPQEPADD